MCKHDNSKLNLALVPKILGVLRLTPLFVCLFVCFFGAIVLVNVALENKSLNLLAPLFLRGRGPLAVGTD